MTCPLCIEEETCVHQPVQRPGYAVAALDEAAVEATPGWRVEWTGTTEAALTLEERLAAAVAENQELRDTVAALRLQVQCDRHRLAAALETYDALEREQAERLSTYRAGVSRAITDIDRTLAGVPHVPLRRPSELAARGSESERAGGAESTAGSAGAARLPATAGARLNDVLAASAGFDGGGI